MDFDAALSILENWAEKSLITLKHQSNTLQLMILTIFVGGPLLIFQTFLGQYTRNSCLFIGEMFPLTYGLGYSMLIMSFYNYVGQVFYTSKLFYYVLITVFNRTPPWMTCYVGFYKKFPGCISKRDIDLCGSIEKFGKPCFPTGNATLSAYIFKEAFSFRRIDVGDRNSKFQRFKAQKLIVAFFCIINSFIVFIFLKTAASKRMKTFYTSLRTGMIFCVVLFTSILVVVFTQPGTMAGLKDVFGINLHPKILTTDAWIPASSKVIRTMRLAEGGHILFGSLIPKSDVDFWRAPILAGVYIILILTATTYYNLFLGQFIYKLNMNVRTLLEGTEENTIFVVFPTSLGILPSSYFFCLIYFIVLTLLSFFSLTVKTIVMEKSITKYFGLSSYYIHLRCTICGVACLISVFYEIHAVFKALSSIEFIPNTTSVIFVSLQLIVLNLYGTGRFSDDVEYITGRKLKKFVRLSWTLSLLIFAYFYYYFIKKIDLGIYTASKLSFIGILTSPLVICVAVKAFTFAKDKNLLGLLRATDRYGPAELDERILRILYNPRLRVKYKRPEEICNHECLLNTVAFKIAVREEINHIMRFMDELKLESGNVHMEENIQEKFKTHLKYLLEAEKEPAS